MCSGYQSYVCLKSISPVGTLLIVVMCCFCPSSSADVTWHVLSDPAIFYRPVYLECKIPNDSKYCKMSIKQWLGGRIYRSLCYDANCRGSKKYAVMNSTCSYVLEIKEFSEDDLNCEYTCSYGITHMRKTLTKDVGRFRYYPKREEVIVRSYMQGDSVVLAFNLTKVFPNPQNCIISINERNFSDVKVLFDGKQSSIFYEVGLMMKLPATFCKGVATIYCSLDSTYNEKVQSINYDNCEDVHYIDGEKERLSTILVVVILVVVFIMMFVLVTLYLRKRTNLRMLQQAERTVQMVSKEQSANNSQEEMNEQCDSLVV